MDSNEKCGCLQKLMLDLLVMKKMATQLETKGMKLNLHNLNG